MTHFSSDSFLEEFVSTRILRLAALHQTCSNGSLWISDAWPRTETWAPNWMFAPEIGANCRTLSQNEVFCSNIHHKGMLLDVVIHSYSEYDTSDSYSIAIYNILIVS